MHRANVGNAMAVIARTGGARHFRRLKMPNMPVYEATARLAEAQLYRATSYQWRSSCSEAPLSAVAAITDARKLAADAMAAVASGARRHHPVAAEVKLGGRIFINHRRARI